MVNSLAHLADIDLAGWEHLHRRAMGMGCARVLDRDDERLAAPDELIALALVELVGLSALAVSATDPRATPPSSTARSTTPCAGWWRASPPERCG